MTLGVSLGELRASSLPSADEKKQASMVQAQEAVIFLFLRLLFHQTARCTNGRKHRSTPSEEETCTAGLFVRLAVSGSSGWALEA